jgi:hypothetical protein
VFEIARVLVHLNHVANIIVNPNHGIVRSAVMFSVADCVADRLRPAIPQPTEWQSIGNQIKAAMINYLCAHEFRKRGSLSLSARLQIHDHHQQDG